MTSRKSQIQFLPETSRAKVIFGLAILLSASLTGAVSQSSEPEKVSFTDEVLPLFQQKCHHCHGSAEQNSGLDLRTRADVLRGGLQGPALVPGEPQESRLYRRVAGLEEPSMPLDSRLSRDEVETLRRWIAEGAEWGTKPIAGTVSSNKGGEQITRGDRDWWSFQKVVRPPVPRGEAADRNRNPVDAFLMRALQKQGIQPAPRADRRTLIRRASLDLLGLLPPPESVTAFLIDESEDAFERLVDTLLDSPHYGERWGRHWLDVARYGDSGGYEHDFDYPNAWRYRDYVINAFNEDKPYDQFIREQLAGDELDEVSFESLIATGFNRVMATVGYREKDNPQYRYTYLNDMITTTSRGFMGLSVECARCHDYKFDPIPQLDYYRMMAIFFPYVKYDHPLVSAQDVAAHQVSEAGIRERTASLKQRISEITEPYKKIAWEKELAEYPEEIQIAVRTPESQRAPGQQLLADQVLAAAGVRGYDELISPGDQALIEKLTREIRNIQKELEPLPVAMGVRDGDYRFAPDGAGDEVQPGKGDREFYNFEGTFLPQPDRPYVPPQAHFLPTANYHNKGPAVEPGFLQVIGGGGDFPTARVPSSRARTSGRRRALAEWIVSRDHPLTARVMVNRIWHHHFGRGIVSTPSNFGLMGQLPSHPALLDWLASEFMQKGWSVKTMHRLIMTSEAYQMSSSHYTTENHEKDRENIYLWRYPQRRLEAEAIRDIILAGSGKLNLRTGGKPFFPPVPKRVVESFNKGRWDVHEEGPEVWRRSVYSYWKRGMRYPLFDVFDLPNLQVTCERRTTTTVPTQALTLLNNQFVLEQARYFAERAALGAGQAPADQVKLAYQIALSRDPGELELDNNLSFLRRQRSYHAGRETADPDLDALADLCHVLLNLNEFVYIQ